MNLPLITIGMATYNAQNTLEQAIQSALAQSWKNKEIIVVDDCSSDMTFEILKKFDSEYKEIKVFRNKKNFGIGYVRNQIIENSNGEFIAFFDDDDKSLRDRLNLQYLRIINYERKYNPLGPVICHSNRKVIYSKNKIKYYKTIGVKNDKVTTQGIEIAKRILLGKPLPDGYGSCPTCSQMARKSTYLRINGFDSSFRRAEDTDLCIRLAYIGTHFVGIKKPLVIQKMTLSFDKGLDIDFKYSILLLKKHKFFIDKNGNYEFCLKWLNIKYIFAKRDFFNFIVSLICIFLEYPLETIKRLLISLPFLKLNTEYAIFNRFK